MSPILDYHAPPPPKPPISKRVIVAFCLSLLTFPPATCLPSVLLLSIAPDFRFFWVFTIFILLPTVSFLCSFKALFHHQNHPAFPRGQNLALAACILSTISCLLGYILAGFVGLSPPN